MEKEELKWEQNEVELEEEDEGGLQVRSSKSIKEVTNGKIETNGHSDFSPKIANGTKRSDLGDEQEKYDLVDDQEKLEDKHNGVEVDEETEPKEESFHELLASIDEFEEGNEVKEEPTQQLVISTNGVEEGTKSEEGSSKSGHLVYYDKDEGSKFTSKPSIKGQIKINPGDGGQESPALDIQFNGFLKSDNLLRSSGQSIKDHSEDRRIVQKSSALDEIEIADSDLTNDGDTDVKDFDVENVIQKQNTHDLYCPNCNSCITRRVIVRKRKRSIRIPTEDIKRNKPEVVVDSKVDVSRAQATNDQVRDGTNNYLDGTPLLEADDHHPDREPEVFRCLSCFSFFIPAGNGLFRIFGKKGDKVNIKGEQTPSTNKNWFSTIFASDKGKASVEQGSGIGTNAVKTDAGVLKPSDNINDQSAKPSVTREYVPPAYSSSEITQESGGDISGSENQDTKMKGKITIGTVGKSENATKNKQGGSVLDMFGEETGYHPNGSASSKEVHGDDKNEEQLRTPGRTQVSNGNLAQDSPPTSQETGLKFLISSTKDESLTIEKSDADLKSDVAILNKGPDNKPHLSWATTVSALSGFTGNGKPKTLTESPQEHEQQIEALHFSESLTENNDNKFQLGSTEGAHPDEVSQHTITKTKFEIHANQPVKVDEDALISSVTDAISIKDTPVNVTNISLGVAAANGIAGTDTVITVEAGYGTAETTSPNLDTQVHVVERQGTDAAEAKKIEIIKSIIFGGLAESITSLSVVTSAAGGDTTTLNILGLGMANLVGGLFIIFHNLWDLKRDHYQQASNQIMERNVDRYRQLLGRRENFILHAVVAVVSYIIFGLVPPIVYGFSFRKSDDRELKLVVVAAASLVCILMLATGKAYVQRPPKRYFKTIATYITLGFMVSGVSYAAGILFKRLLDKLGIFQSGSTNDLLFSEVPGTGAAWASF